MNHAACVLLSAVPLSWSCPLVQAQVVEFARATLQNQGASSGSGIATTNFFYSGWRFEVTTGPLETTNIGGHFSGNGAATMFGAIVRLTGPDDSPDRFDLLSSDIIATTVFSGPAGFTSQEVTTPLTLTLVNGWYAVLFGAGAFGASANGGGLMAQDASSAIPGAQNIVTYRQASHPAGEGGPFLQGLVCRVFVHAAASCAADFNRDGTPDFFDYLDFVAAFSSLDPSADFNGDQSIDFFDYRDFVQAFSAGC